MTAKPPPRESRGKDVALYPAGHMSAHLVYRLFKKKFCFEEYLNYLPSILRQRVLKFRLVTTDCQSSKDDREVFQGMKEYVLFVTVVR